MNIMHIGNVNSMANGVGQVIKNLSKSQRLLGHEVLTLTARHKQEELPSFVEVHTKRDFKILLDRFKPDIFVFHSLYIWEYIKFYPILQKRKIPFLLQLHGALSEENYRKSHYKKVIANSLFYRKFIKAARSIIYLNQGELSKTIVKNINPNTAIIPNGCDEPTLPPQIRSNGNGRLEFLYVGRIEIYHKGLDVLVDAIKKLNLNGYANKVHFTFFGIGKEEDLSKFREMLSPLKAIAEFKGSAYGETKEKAYQSSDYFILTSRYEGMPMAILEALSHGRPCFVTPATNVGDIISEYDCGFVSTLDAEVLAHDIIKEVQQFELKKDRLFKNSINAAKSFHWKQIAKKTIDLYKSVISKEDHLC
ncbi:MAG: glycosyltransferase [Bacteroidales bacterium]|nr:glycosyltransferase [Bacteroidales bacterium]